MNKKFNSKIRYEGTDYFFEYINCGKLDHTIKENYVIDIKYSKSEAMSPCVNFKIYIHEKYLHEITNQVVKAIISSIDQNNNEW